MKLLISHVYSEDNKGDAALLAMQVEEIGRVFGDARITILSMGEVTSRSEFEGVPVKPALMHNIFGMASRLGSWSRGVYMMSSTLCWATIRRFTHLRPSFPRRWHETLCEYDTADLILPVGGGYLRSASRLGTLYNLALLLHPLVVGRILGKPTVLYTQSIGPFARRIDRLLAGAVLRHCVDGVILREEESVAIADLLGLRKVFRSVDAGFLLAVDPACAVSLDDIDRDVPLVGVTARSWLTGGSQRDYERALAETIDHIVGEHGAHVVMIPQVTASFHGDDDRLVHDAIYEMVEHKSAVTKLDQNFSYREIKSLYDQLDMLIGTRFHSVIFSLTSYCPAVAIAYEHKTTGIMRELGLESWVLPIEEVRATRLIPMVDQLFADRSRLNAHLKLALPEYAARAKGAMDTVASIYVGRRNAEADGGR